MNSDLPLNRRAFVKLGLAAGAAAATPGVLFGQPSAEAQAQGATVHVLPELGYELGALEPHIDAKTMEIHHHKHHAAYVANLNAALAEHPKLHSMPAGQLIANVQAIADPALRAAVRNNGGGHVNHSMFWELIGPAATAGAPTEALQKAITTSFGTLADMQKAIGAAGLSRFGSGWAWLIVRNGTLAVTSTPNQDHPQMAGLIPDAEVGIPVLGIDVWEHAYYLNYQNRRADYLAAIWNVIQWPKVSARFAEAIQA
jgi:Fe-Mn family superoxide dismutase